MDQFLEQIETIQHQISNLVDQLSVARDRAKGDEKTRLRRLCKHMEHVETIIVELR